ncbi:NAD(P)(+) transhydrogenase (Re/Si-specific) subunit beta [Spirochaeta lutea]|uniref:NAD(P) transhydrogenase subunit beta n=1 Tax=Spirochaeta lutea TaxID=1480694 RepID=A0A098QW86_9SPIO|nr:NAD(P)(+) transhydrogenase (Re/Si-specific) subunit beta [Spirochaeta lutea]KGE71964.1 NAD synthetase [Spirochaeta lutea]
MELTVITNLVYLLAAVLFILGLKGLGHPRTAVRGNLLGAVAMLMAIVVTLVANEIVKVEWVIAGIVLGSLIGGVLALKIKMTAMPQLVGLFNGFGGLASVLVATVAIIDAVTGFSMGKAVTGLVQRLGGVAFDPQFVVATAFSAFVGGVTFWGSLIAFGKLQGIVSEKSVRYPGDQIVKALVFVASLVMGVLVVIEPSNLTYYWILLGLSSLLGLLLTVPIGGADMPIVIALLNSYSGIAAAATGFVLNNTILIIAGSLVGASGIILTQIMCKAMNRSLANVLFGGLGGAQVQEDLGDIYTGKIKSTSADEVAMILKSAQRVVFVPGYGMAVARAQTAVRQLTEALEKDGIQVEFGIHPVAGRMPGHMNVLLAEENISYDKLREMDAINPSFPNTDVAIVIGANDVVNPLARDSQGSPISGMPILDVDKARTVVVIKRSLSPGFAGIDNPLFAADNTLMLFGDGKQAVEDMISAYKDA